MSTSPYRIAVLIPCFNEEAAIEKVVRDFKSVLPEARIYVFDNNSIDGTVAVARSAGAEVRHVRQQGKGNVVRCMFADVEADIYILVDGDDTYDAASAPAMIDKLVNDRLEMVIGYRRATEAAAYRSGHRLGNRLLTGCVLRLFGGEVTDVLSGYRVFSRRFVKSFPALATSFETEIEVTVHALALRMPLGEVSTPYRARPPGSASKLRTYRDGWRLLRMILKLFKMEKPLPFFSIVAGVLGSIALMLAVPIMSVYLATGLVPRFPTAILCMGLMILASLSFACGLILDTVTMGRREIKRLMYLQIPNRVEHGGEAANGQAVLTPERYV